MAPHRDACSGDQLPYVLNVGLPPLPEAQGVRSEGLQREVEALFKAFYKDHGLCPSRKLQINITVAGNYEILDWMAQGLIDVAVVPDLSVYLLTQHDAVPLQEMAVAAETDRLADLFRQAFFAGTHFAVDCDSLARTPANNQRSCWQLPADAAVERDGLVDVLFPGEGVPGSAAVAGAPLGREHLVIASRAAGPIFAPGLPAAAVTLPAVLEGLFKPRNPPVKSPPAAFLRMLDPEPTFGVR